MLPRAIFSRETFENATRLDIAMGGSTNTMLHILAIAQAADEDVNGAGGILGIMAELTRLDLLDLRLGRLGSTLRKPCHS